MYGFMYPASLVLLALLAYTFNQSNNSKLALLMILIGIYIVYSHETGHTVTDWKNEMVESIDKSAEDFSSSRGAGGYDANKAKEAVK